MDMKKILQAFDGAATKKVEGANDMKKFMSIVNENANPYKPLEENVVTSFEEGSVGGDANAFLIAADNINDEVMGQIDKIKINADPQLLKNLMSKFNEFMSAYHAVGKEILQPDMFDELPGDATSTDNTEESVSESSVFSDVINSSDMELSLGSYHYQRAAYKEGLAAGIKMAKTGVKDRHTWGGGGNPNTRLWNRAFRLAVENPKAAMQDLKLGDSRDDLDFMKQWDLEIKKTKKTPHLINFGNKHLENRINKAFGQQGVEEAVDGTPDFEARRKGKKPADLGSSDAWYHRAMSPTYYGFEKDTPEYAEYVKAYDEWDEGPRGGKQWESIDKGLSFKDYVNLQEAKQGLK